MKSIPLTNSTAIVLVDDEDYSRVMEFRWQLNETKTSKRIVMYSTFAGFTQRLANFIMNDTNNSRMFDHIDRNPFNNCKNNLREATKQQNCFNTSKRQNTSSKYKGVSLNKRLNKWHSYISRNYNRINIGWFETEEAAARAYDVKARELFGEFANLNFK